MESKTVSNSKVVLSEIMMPGDANPAGNIHGGTIMKIIDNAALIAAMRHTHQNCVTASVDKIDFISPVFIGNVVFAYASVNYVANSSLEIGVRVEAECLRTGNHTHVASAYLTFVALNDQGKPVKIAPIIPEEEVEKRRYQQAKERREYRIKHRTRHHHNNPPCNV